MRCGVCRTRLATRGLRVTNGRRVPIYAPCPNLADPSKHPARHRRATPRETHQHEAPFSTGTRLHFLGRGPFAQRLAEGAQVEIWDTVGTRSLFRSGSLVGAIWPEHAGDWRVVSATSDSPEGRS